MSEEKELNLEFVVEFKKFILEMMKEIPQLVLKTGYDCVLNSIDLEMATNDEFALKLRYSYSLQFQYIFNDNKSHVYGFDYFPMNFSWGSIINSLMAKNMSNESAYQMFNIIKNNIETTKEEIAKKEFENFGNDKFRYYTEKYMDNLKEHISIFFKRCHVNIINMRGDFGESNPGEVKYGFEFDKDLSYIQKKNLQNDLERYILKNYQKLNTSANNFFDVPDIRIDYPDRDRKMVPVKYLYIKTKMNSYRSLGIDDSANNVPILSMHKKSF